ncbi:iron complex transport system substrate-binding protein [Devosia sp. YR412]|uniref:ABC transporter substrate-binding protein n=1 Tax=Devosia sp. YR412 TaxID=1881030 RepID=UPI0008D347DB|nr:iron-siderophore ABC transporter substrate-binding protein [Devosia sp. YR412]SEQ37821.1 iron complex transport system substrate-binding protein [Devosia sp. YR412]
MSQSNALSLPSGFRTFLALAGAVALLGTVTTATLAAGETHVVTHARGATEVPSQPQRVVVLEPVQLDTAIALGIVPVGSPTLNASTGIPKYLGEEAAGITVVGTFMELKLEAIAALLPDLIIGTETRHSAYYDQLSAIAPTVFMATQTDPWRDNLQFTANALGSTAGADQLLAAYDQRCEDIKQRYNVEGKTAQFIRPRDTVLSIYAPSSFAGSTLECVGFKIPDRDWDDAISSDISPELVLDATADYVFVAAADPSAADAIPASIRANEASFPKLFAADSAYWISGVGSVGGMAVLDDIEKALSAE